jgi:Cu(I)/Ag(I) efflux system membrane fusion protein
MKNKIIKSFLLMCPLFALLLLATSCRKGGPATKPADVDYYTCTMHPSVKLQDPKAKCPICSMDLVPVKKAGTTNAVSHGEHSHAVGAIPADMPTEFVVPTRRQQLIGVTYAKVEMHPLALTVRAVGTVAYNKQQHWDYVARVEGYVQKLFVFSRGELVEKNAPLLTLFSPDLLTTQNEFVDVLKQQEQAASRGDKVPQENVRRLLDSAKQRLRLWNISEEQIAELERTRQPQETITLRSPFTGVVQDLGVDQGRRVAVGEHLVDIVDLSSVWVWAQFYETELPLLKKGLPVTISIPGDPDTSFSGTISVLDPFINETTRTGRVRIDVLNPDLKLKPEMYVDVQLKLDQGEGLSMPVSAVLPTGQRNLVFVDKGEGKLEPRFIQLGRKYGELYEIKSGLKESESVVASANFLIDAEAKVQGALKSW